MVSTTTKAFRDVLLQAGVGHHTRIAVALSGGPDSTALAALASAWHREVGAVQAYPRHDFRVNVIHSLAPASAVLQHQSENNTPPPLALIVDHKLRQESSAEAQQVSATAASLGLDTQVLTIDWGLKAPTKSKTQLAARAARYDLLSSACNVHGCSVLLLGHHQGLSVVGSDLIAKGPVQITTCISCDKHPPQMIRSKHL